MVDLYRTDRGQQRRINELGLESNKIASPRGDELRKDILAEGSEFPLRSSPE